MSADDAPREGLIARIRNDIGWTWLAIEVLAAGGIVIAWFLLR